MHSQSGEADHDPIGEDWTIIHLDNILVEFARWEISIPEVIGWFDAILESADVYDTMQ